MILWFILFGLIVLVSLVLAIQSMKDYQEIPQETEYSLFLIRKTKGLTSQILDSFHKFFIEGEVLSFERLVKGGQSALVVYGPSKILLQYKEILDLIELEDYTKIDSKMASVWEIGIVQSVDRQTIFQNLPQFLTEEQFWWQLLLSSKEGGSFFSQIRVVVVSEDPTRRKELTNFLKKLKASSRPQLLDFYQKRAFRKDPSSVPLNSEGIKNLLIL